MLHSAKGTTNSNCKKNIRKMHSLPMMKQFLCAKCRWTAAVFDLMHWQSHGTSVRKICKRKHFTVKLVHDRLPVGHPVSKCGEQCAIECPSCNAEVETQHHLFQCEKRKGKRKESFDKLEKCHKHNDTKQELQDIFQDGLRKWFRGTGMKVCCPGEKCKQLVRNQERVGWDHVPLGRFALEWKETQHEHIKTLPKAKRRKSQSGSTWVTGLMRLLWDFAHEAWLERNDDGHGADAETREKRRMEEATKQTEALHENRNKVLPIHRDVFHKNMEEHLANETTSIGLQQWIRTWQAPMQTSMKQATARKFSGMLSTRTLLGGGRQEEIRRLFNRGRGIMERSRRRRETHNTEKSLRRKEQNDQDKTNKLRKRTEQNNGDQMSTL